MPPLSIPCSQDDVQMPQKDIEQSLHILMYYFSVVVIINHLYINFMASKQEKIILTVLEARNPKSRCLQGCAPSKDSREESLLLLVSGGSRHSLACGCITPVSDSIFTWPSVCVCVLLLWGHLSPDVGLPSVIQDNLIWKSLIYLHLQRPLLQIRSYPLVPGEHIFWGATIHPTTLYLPMSSLLLVASQMHTVIWVLFATRTSHDTLCSVVWSHDSALLTRMPFATFPGRTKSLGPVQMSLFPHDLINTSLAKLVTFCFSQHIIQGLTWAQLSA